MAVSLALKEGQYATTLPAVVKDKQRLTYKDIQKALPEGYKSEIGRKVKNVYMLANKKFFR